MHSHFEQKAADDNVFVEYGAFHPAIIVLPVRKQDLTCGHRSRMVGERSAMKSGRFNREIHMSKNIAKLLAGLAGDDDEKENEKFKPIHQKKSLLEGFPEHSEAIKAFAV